jgi:hypothetical protein
MTDEWIYLKFKTDMTRIPLRGNLCTATIHWIPCGYRMYLMILSECFNFQEEEMNTHTDDFSVAVFAKCFFLIFLN